jgi:hypothetical protein
MNPREAAELLGHCAAFDNRKPSQGAAIAWAAALHDVPLDDDAKAAVASYYTTPPKDPDGKLWILPHHVRTLRTKIRSARLENFQYEPIADETVPEYLARLRGQTQAIASGRVAAPTGRLALEGGPHRDVVLELEAARIGALPDEEVELVDKVRRSGPLGIVCPKPECKAEIGRPCKTPGGNSRQPLGKPRLNPHSARVRAAAGNGGLTVEQATAQEQRVRAATDRHFANRDADIPDAVIVDEEAAS